MEKLKQILKDETKYRLTQCYQAIFCNLINNWQEAMNLPLELRNKLDDKFPLEVGVDFFESKDKKTIKALVELNDKRKVETVLMRHNKRNTICVSSQVGCSLNCSFCATGKMGFTRNLSSWEIVLQVLIFTRMLKSENYSNDKVNNIVFMGMGEPFLNYENVINAIKVLNDKKGLNIGARHISISTAGIVEGIKQLAKEKIQINLAISLHAPDNILRKKLMPIANKYSIKDILGAVNEYIGKTSRKVMFEYLLIDGVNDKEKNARALVCLMNKKLYMVNLIPCNPVGKYRPSSKKVIQHFKSILEENKINVTQRLRLGEDIKGACGQLATINSHKTRIH